MVCGHAQTTPNDFLPSLKENRMTEMGVDLHRVVTVEGGCTQGTDGRRRMYTGY